jgi:exopolysaccharide biosynthesis WecB/TagA/CpsF family protein
VDILGLRFPRLTREQALAMLLDLLARRRCAGVCFPDMSTMNLAVADPGLLAILRDRMVVLNDGAGLAWAARRRGHPFPDNLNGTDLCPALLASAPAGTRVFLLGGRPGVAAAARATLEALFPEIEFVGTHHGYFSAETEAAVVDEIAALRPGIVLVGMGNPTQVRFIARRLEDGRNPSTIWFAVGGLLDYYGAGLKRAPEWVRNAGLEWLHIVTQQPHKLPRYFLGIPRFIARCTVAGIRHRHDAAAGEPGPSEDRHC